MIAPHRLGFLVAGLLIACSSVVAGRHGALAQTARVPGGGAGAHAAPASASEPPVLHAAEVPGAAVRLDGRLDEAAWAEAGVATRFTQQEPVEGGTPSAQTRIRVFYDDEALYLGAELHYQDPSNVVARKLRRDAGLGSDDRLMWILDTYHDGRTAYFFETNPAGLRGDGLLTTGQGVSVNKSWDGVWDVATTRTDVGWTAEIRIPFQSLQFNPDQTTWGFNVQRTIRRKNEEILWAGYPRDEGLFRPRFAGELRGLSGLSQGLGLEVTPFGIARTEWDGTAKSPGEEARTTTADVGGEVSYSITPTLRSALTVNTDFAEVEVDQRRVNLTRFPLFFPERRDFFLEGANVYEFAPRSAQYPYFSRRIGLVDGAPVPILAGARVNGREGAYSFGALHVRTRSAEGVPADSLTLPPEDFTVARLNRNVGAESKVGVIYTRRATHPGALDGDVRRRNGDRFERLQNRHTLGADLALSTSEFLGDRNLQFQAFVVGHNAPVRQDTSSFGQRTTRGLRVNFPNDPWFAHTSYREFGTAYDPAVGFVFRRGFRRLQPSVSYKPTLESSDLVRRIGFGLSAEYLTDLTLQPQTVHFGATPFEIQLESGDSADLSINRNFERLKRPFDILGTGRIVLPPGTYTTYTSEVDLRTARYRPLSGDLEGEYGGFWSGTRTVLEAGLTLRPVLGLSLSGDWEYTRADLREGSFRTHVFRLDGSVDLSPDLAVTTQVQYDNLSDRLGLFARLRWIVEPGSDLYLVYRRNWRAAGDRLSPLTSTAAAKLTYSFRF